MTHTDGLIYVEKHPPKWNWNVSGPYTNTEAALIRNPGITIAVIKKKTNNNNPVLAQNRWKLKFKRKTV